MVKVKGDGRGVLLLLGVHGSSGLELTLVIGEEVRISSSD